jgi:hypothetical protein
LGLAPTLREEAVLCGKGRFLQGCPALLSKDPRHAPECVSCQVPEVEADRALFAEVGLEDAEPCKWACRDGYYEAGHGSGRRCVRCGEPERCAAGSYWQNCSETADSMCRACADLRERADADGEVHERYVDAALEKQEFDADAYPGADAYNRSMPGERERLEAALKRANGTHVCRSRCAAGAFRSADGLCKRCTPAEFVREQQQEQSLDANAYFAVFPCGPGRDASAERCVPRSGTEILGHDPAATGDCPRQCLAGWTVNITFNEGAVAYVRSCARCARATVIDAQNGTTLVHEDETSTHAFAFALNSCALACTPPYVRLRERLRWTNATAGPEALRQLDPERTCVRCSEDACPIGSYPTGLLCECAQCVMDDMRD